MDVACVLLGEPADLAVKAWGEDGQWHLDRLINGSLLSIRDGRLAMHDQLRDMGRSFVNKRTSLDGYKGLYCWSEVGL